MLWHIKKLDIKNYILLFIQKDGGWNTVEKIQGIESQDTRCENMNVKVWEVRSEV